MVGELRTAEEQADELRLLCEAYTRSLEKCLHTHTMPDEKKLVSGFIYQLFSLFILIISGDICSVYISLFWLLSCFSSIFSQHIFIFSDFHDEKYILRLNISEKSARVPSGWRTEGVSQLFTISWEPWTQRSAEVCFAQILKYISWCSDACWNHFSFLIKS